MPNSQPGAIHMYGGGVTAYLDKLAMANWTNKLGMGLAYAKGLTDHQKKLNFLTERTW